MTEWGFCHTTFISSQEKERNMNNNTELNDSPRSYIYNFEHSNTDVQFLPIQIVDGNTDINSIQLPFHLSSSIRLQSQQKYRNKSGFTGQSGIEYIRISTLTEFLTHARVDVSASLFQDNYRGKNRMIESDVLVFDIDNHLPLQPELLEDESLHLTIEKFGALFKDYEFLISTSLNHQKVKDDLFARHKFHVFMALGRKITDESEIAELIQKLDYYIKSQTHNYGSIEMGSNADYSLIDGSVGGHSQVWGNEDTTIYYNKGGSIYDLLYEKDFSDDYRGYIRNSGEQKYRRFKENQTAAGDYEIGKSNLLDDFDYINIISRIGKNRFYDIAFKVGGSSGYYMGICDFHEDDKASLQIFENGGYNCFGCGKSGISALQYESDKTGQSISDIRKKYLKELGDVTHQDFLIWLDEKGKLKNTLNDDSDAVSVEIYKNLVQAAEDENLDGNDKDEYFLYITKTGSIRADRELYDVLERMNQKHAILSHSGKINVMCRETSRNSEYKQFTWPSIDDFKKRYRNDRYFVRTFNKKKEPIFKEMDIGTIWELWEHRRQYDGIDFWPYDDRSSRYDDDEIIWDYWDDWSSAAKENGWVGEKVKRGLSKFMDIGVLNGLSTNKQHDDALKGCDLYLTHISENILGNYTGANHNRFYDYFISWMSRTLTHHGQDRIKIVPVLKGKQGCGKGICISRFGELFGKHFLHVQESRTITHNFNMQLMDALLVYVNEAVFAGNKQTMNRLKGLITEDELQLEEKYLPAFTGRSHLRFIYSSNEDWVVPIEWDNRRYWMLECGDKYVGNSKSYDYFNNLMKQWNVIGRESLYKFLTSDKIMDMASEIRFEYDMPATSAASHQLIQTDDVYGWIHQILIRGGHYYIDDDRHKVVKHWEGKGNYDNSFSITPIFEDYKQFCRDKGITYKDTEHALSGAINKISNKMKWPFRSHKINADLAKRTGSTRTVWQFGNLDTIREIWVKELFTGSYEDAGFVLETKDNLEDFVDSENITDEFDMPPERKSKFDSFVFDSESESGDERKKVIDAMTHALEDSGPDSDELESDESESNGDELEDYFKDLK